MSNISKTLLPELFMDSGRVVTKNVRKLVDNIVKHKKNNLITDIIKEKKIKVTPEQYKAVLSGDMGAASNAIEKNIVDKVHKKLAKQNQLYDQALHNMARQSDRGLILRHGPTGEAFVLKDDMGNVIKRKKMSKLFDQMESHGNLNQVSPPNYAYYRNPVDYHPQYFKKEMAGKPQLLPNIVSVEDAGNLGALRPGLMHELGHVSDLQNKFTDLGSIYQVRKSPIVTNEMLGRSLQSIPASILGNAISKGGQIASEATAWKKGYKELKNLGVPFKERVKMLGPSTVSGLGSYIENAFNPSLMRRQGELLS